jgi:ABC-type multidrug transport system fused ATPase/permease subunit
MKNNLKLFLRFSKISLPYWDKILLSFIVENCVYLIILLPPLILRVLFDYAYPYRDLKILVIFSLIPFVLAILINFLQVLRSFLDLYVNQGFFKTFYATLYSKIQRLPMSFFQTHQVGDLLYRMTDDLQVIENTVLTIVPKLSGSIFKLVFILALCFSINIPLTLLALAGVPLHFFQTHFFANKLKIINKENQEKNAMIFDMLEERLANIKLVKLFHKCTVEVKQLLKQISVLFVIERKAKLTLASHNLFSTIINRSWILLLGLYTGYCIINGKLTLGEVVAISSYFAILQSPFDTISALYRRFVTSQISFKRISDILDHPVEYSEEDSDGEDIMLNGNITFDKVGFGYKEKKKILNNISFEVKQGTSLAIVGRSGIGKSSIIDLIMKFYSLTEGQILLDNTNINDIKISSLRNQIALISQDTCLFSGTVKENIIFGYEGACTEDDIIDIAKQADAHSFIMSLPQGYATDVGVRGSRLSTGERQRIAIARALLRKPKIIIFDEATSSLDSQSEKQVQKSLEQFKNKTTIIFITHRLSSIQNFDNVIVIGNDGKIAEKGSVPELMEEKGLFYKLYELQLGGFQRFINHLNFLLKSLKHNNRPVSVALFSIANFDQLLEDIEEMHLERFIDDIGIILSLLLRDIDHCSYHSKGIFWISFPETSVIDAENNCNKLKEYIQKISFKDLPDKKLDVNWQVTECLNKDTIDILEKRLMGKLKNYV